MKRRLALLLIPFIGAVAVASLIVIGLYMQSDGQFLLSMTGDSATTEAGVSTQGLGWFDKLTVQTGKQELFPATQLHEGFD